MYSRKLRCAQILLERFLEKSKRRNIPLEQYREEDTYLAFQDKTEKIIAKQLTWAANHLGEMKIWDNDELAQHQIEARIGDYLDKYMPEFKDEMPYDTVYDNFEAAFVWSCKANYRRLGAKILSKAAPEVEFELTNEHYLSALADDSNFLLNTKSTAYDQTTKDRLITIVRDGRLKRDTIDEVASDLKAQVDGISSVRAFMIANTETANAFGQANQAMLEKNDIPKKEWVIAGPHNLVDECDDNEAASPIDSTDEFPSGDLHEPAHINCECYTQGTGLDLTSMSDDELSGLVLWNGS